MFAVLHLADFSLQAVLRARGPGAAAAGAGAAVAAEREETADAPARGAPAVGLLSGDSKRAVVTALTAPARAAGVEPGMSAPHAQARCPGIELLAPDTAAEKEAQALLLAVAWQVGANVESTAPGVATIDLTALDDARREPAVRAAVAELTALALPASGGLAPTPLLALYAARAAGEMLPRSSVPPGHGTPQTDVFTLESESAGDPAPGRVEEAPARLSLGGAARATREARASDEGPPRAAPPNRSEGTLESAASVEAGTHGRAASFSENPRPPTPARAPVLVVRDGAAFLAPLPLTAAEPSPELASIVATWGVRTLGDFAALGKRAVARRLGAEGVALWERARGETTRPLHLAVPPGEFVAAQDFEHEIETLEPLLFVLRRFVERLALELRAAGFVAADLQLALRLADATGHARAFWLPEPTGDVEILFRALHTHLESLHTAAPIVGLRLEISPVRPLVRQRGLFDAELRDPHGFAATLARVVALVGSDRVGTPQVNDTHRPDSFSLAAPASVVPPPAPAPVHAAVGLPLRRYRPPLAATVELDGRAPAFVWCERARGAVAAARGPWRGGGEWWEAGRTWEREEWDVALAGGGLYRVVHTPEGWFVEGMYD